MEAKTFQTIRQVASTGLLSEYTLRTMEKRGELPCVYSGRRCLVNYPVLLEMLDKQSREKAGLIGQG